MIQPHGNTLVDRVVTPQRAKKIRAGFDELFAVKLDRNLFFDFVNLAQGVYSPLEGFMSRNNFMKVINDITLESGVVWPLPVVLDINAETANDITPGERIGIARTDGTPVGVLDVDSVYRYNEDEVCTQLFGTTDEDHPGVRTVQSKAPFLLAEPSKRFQTR
jgi:sulfate adenylyltransferase